MEWVEALSGAKVALDAAPLIYFAEEHPHYLPLIEPFFVALDQGRFQALASTVALLEVLIHPIRENNLQLAQTYREILQQSGVIATIPVSAAIAETAANLRAHSKIKTPDALHVATALHTGAGFFITNDRRLPTVQGLKIIALADL